MKSTPSDLVRRTGTGGGIGMDGPPAELAADPQRHRLPACRSATSQRGKQRRRRHGPSRRLKPADDCHRWPASEPFGPQKGVNEVDQQAHRDETGQGVIEYHWHLQKTKIWTERNSPAYGEAESETLLQARRVRLSLSLSLGVFVF
jgi:hypothetical protein